MYNEYSTELQHHGILGQRWGVRRYQNEDGTLTKAGRARAIKDLKKTNKWAVSQHQPSSVLSSIRAGKYAAHPTKGNAKRLDKSNEKDEIRYQATKKVAKEIGNKMYSVKEGKRGNTKVVDVNGKGIKRGAVRNVEKNLKQNDKEKYREYKRLRSAANSGLTYIGNSQNMAMMTMAINSATKYSRDEARRRCNEIIAEYANMPIAAIANDKRD